MALTISTGFVVDDAIVMIENIARYIEEGETPFEAALKGAKQIGFTIVSLTVSLVAVLIPLLFMGGIIGRLFREFAVTLGVAIGVSAVAVADAHGDDVRAPPASPSRSAKSSASSTRASRSAASTRCSRSTTAACRWVLAHQRTHARRHDRDGRVHRAARVVVPKGFFPQQDTGLIIGVTEAPPDVSFPRMMELPAGASPTSSAPIPDVATRRVVHRRRRHEPHARTAAASRSRSKPRDERDAERATRSSRACSRSSPQSTGIDVYLQAVQDLQIDTRVEPHAVPVHARGRRRRRAREWAPQHAREAARRCPSSRDVASDQQTRRPAARARHRSRHGLAPRRLAAGDRRHALRRLRPAPGLDHLHAAQPVPRHPRGEARVPAETREALDQHLRAARRRASRCRCRAFAHYERTPSPLSINHQGQFPSVTLSFNVARRRVARRRGRRHPRRRCASSGCRPGVHGEFQGTAQAFSESLASEPMLILAALITVYIVLGVLYESYIHPITILSTLPSAGVGALLALMVCRQRVHVIALIGIMLLIGIVKKNAIMMIDFALEAEREQGMSPQRGDLPGVPAALPADHDDDDGGAARRRCRSRSAPAPAPSCAGRSASPSSAACSSRRSSRSTRRRSSTSTWSAPALGASVGTRRDGPLATPEPRGAAAAEPRTARGVREHLRAVHPPADRDVAAGGRRSCSRACAAYTLLPVAPLPRVDFPTIQCQRGAARREPGDDGLVGGDAARAPLRPHRRRHRDHLDELARHHAASRCSSISIATSTRAARDVQAAINAAGGELPAEPADAADLPQGEPGRLADPDPRR